MKSLKKINYRRIITIIVLLAILVIYLVPLYWAVVMSFDRRSTTEIPPFSILPHEPSFFNYKVAASFLDLWKYFKNTLFVTIVNTVISVFSALCCGYAFSKGSFRFKKLWYILFIAVLMIPFEAKFIPLYLQYNKWGLIDTYWPLILGNFAYSYGLFFARQNIAAIPNALRESAILEGASEWQVFMKIIVPLSKPTIATLSILQIISHWNAYLWPLVILRSKEKQLISVGVSLFNATESSIYYGPRMAVAVLSAVPLIILFLFAQKYIVQSIALSGVKE